MSAEASDPAMLGVTRYADDHDPFWPRVALTTLRAQLGLGEGVSEAQLQLAARSAASIAAGEFAQWRRVLRERGFTRLEDLAAHPPGQALSQCYRTCLAYATQRALARNGAAVRPSSAEVEHD